LHDVNLSWTGSDYGGGVMAGRRGLVKARGDTMTSNANKSQQISNFAPAAVRRWGPDSVAAGPLIACGCVRKFYTSRGLITAVVAQRLINMNKFHWYDICLLAKKI
jgi:hypothetical protein